MAEELTEVMERLALNEKEQKGSEILLEDMSEGIKECKLSLIGKIIGESLQTIMV